MISGRVRSESKARNPRNPGSSEKRGRTSSLIRRSTSAIWSCSAKKSTDRTLTARFAPSSSIDYQATFISSIVFKIARSVSERPTNSRPARTEPSAPGLMFLTLPIRRRVTESPTGA